MANNSSLQHNFTYINHSKIVDMLYGDEKYIAEFSEAAVDSFKEFSEKYREHIIAQDETAFRKAGHKIKPIAQMIGITEIIDEYEHGKSLIQNQATQADCLESADNIDAIIHQVIDELESI